ncbi:transglutaminase family protein [Cyanobium sp. CH-040]|uniref:transglutaminase family protein n=1 Tax=Cyanobium sp. CH-040 TaxID=2823708 RepID=UPI0020CCD72F|nr:transglutaminase family protein [Cyanobium sp. CH-040]MCP9928607.1 transglutaminase family protein [Cyanobium sp. CH-040]
MFFHIRHALRYAYGRAVFLEPTTLRLTPRSDPAQRLLHHELRVTPEPSGRTRVLEADGTEAVVLWFAEVQEQLTLEVDMVVRTLRENPFDWIITHPAALGLPASYPPDEALSLAPCLEGVTPIAHPVREWAAELAAAVDGSASAFLMHLADTIHHDFHHIGRPDGEPMQAVETLRSRSGACRDTAMLYVQACRSLGLAARFVSGYSMHHPEEVSEHELHAWAEVYLPGGGWRGYDPSLGLAVADGHVALAAAPDHHLAAPVSGRYRGTGVNSSMRYAVEVRAAESLEALKTLDRDHPLQMPAPEQWLSGEAAAGTGTQEDPSEN